MSENWYKHAQGPNDPVRLVQERYAAAVAWTLMPGGDPLGWAKKITHTCSDLGINVEVLHAEYAKASVVVRADCPEDPVWLVSIIFPPPSRRAGLPRKRRRFFDLLRLMGPVEIDPSGFPIFHYGRRPHR